MVVLGIIVVDKCVNIVGNWEHTTFKCFDLNGYPTNCRKRRRGSEGNPKAPATVAGKEQQDLIFAQQKYQKPHYTQVIYNLRVLQLQPFIIIIIIFHTDFTAHIYCSLDFFDSYEPCQAPLRVQWLDATVSLVTHVETVSFLQDFLLKNVSSIPSFKLNLLSGSQLTKSNKYQIIFSSDSC